LNAKSAASSVLYDYYKPEARAVVPPATFTVKESSHEKVQAPKARNMIARGKCDAKRSTSPLVAYKKRRSRGEKPQKIKK
jgi:hypothetical protein